MYRAVHVCLLGACGRTGWEGLVKVWRAWIEWIGGFDEFRGRIPYSLALSRGHTVLGCLSLVFVVACSVDRPRLWRQ